MLTYLDRPLKISFIKHESPSSCTLHNSSYKRHTFRVSQEKDNKIVKMYWGGKKKSLFKMLTF